MDTVIPPVLRDSAVQAETVGRRGRIDWRDLLIFLLAFALLTTVLALSGVFPAREQLTEEQGDVPGIQLETRQITVKLLPGATTQFAVQLANNGSREGRYLLQVQDIQQLIAPDALNTTLGAGERTGISFTIQVPVTKESGVYSGGIAVMVENTTASIPVTVIIGSRQPRQLVVDLGITGNRLPVVEATVYNVGRQVRVDTRLSVTVDNANGSQVRHWQQNLTVGTAREIRKRLEALQPGEYTVRAAIAYDDRRSTAMQTIRIEGDRGRERDRLPALPFNPVPALKIVVLLALAGILALVTERVYHKVSHLELPGSAEEDVTRPATPREEREKIRVREAITCEDCGREFVSEENYRIHRNTHHG